MEHNNQLWQEIRNEALLQAAQEPMLASFYHATIIKHEHLIDALSYILADRFGTQSMPPMAIREVFQEAYYADPEINHAAICDINAILHRDPAVTMKVTPLLYLKGFHALQGYRVAHWLWGQGRIALALYFQNQISVTCQVDIHPAAQIGYGIMLDHATGIVIGETAVVGNNVSMLQNVTLGGTGKDCGDRHPKIGTGVMIGAGAKILGNIKVGDGAKIGSGSVVLNPVPAHTTVAGVPAKIVGHPGCQAPSIEMNQSFDVKQVCPILHKQ